MTRNSKRLQPDSNPEYQENKTQQTPTKKAPSPQPKGSNPFGISFVVPTEQVKLPSEGAYYPVSSPLYKREEVEIRFMTAKEEDVFASSGAGGSSFEKLIDSLLIDDSITSKDFLEEDKMAILLSARRSGYGQNYTTMVYCANCDEETEHEFDLSKVSTKHNPSNESKYDPNTDTFKFTLPLSKLEVELLNIAPKHNESIEAERKQKKKYNLPFNFTVSFIKTALVSANGVADPQELSKLAESLPAADAKHILNFYADCRPNIDTTQEVSCSVCGTTTEREVPLSWAFFRTDV